ncbi:hypothetical protein ACFXB3_27415 [Streptomyces sp. NPDC059447]|uniref:hypothetical protein n=1 Tax=Streptomyces sp. NPDC059447 TaxID=3346834 RepID=UPI0036CBA429
MGLDTWNWTYGAGHMELNVWNYTNGVGRMELTTRLPAQLDTQLATYGSTRPMVHPSP